MDSNRLPNQTLPNTKPTSESDIENSAPKWMKNMGSVARFFMYQIDIRFSKKFVLYFYLEDDSISIGEMPDYSRLSSGSPPHQALFLKRHRVPNSEANRDFVITDFFIGKTIAIYGRVFHIYSCDQFTRDWLAEHFGIELSEGEREPEDNLFPVGHLEPLIPRDQRLFNPANAGYPTVEQLNASRKFLQDDGSVLRFWVRVSPPNQSLIWDEQSHRVKTVILDPEDPIYVMRHFLADDTTELVLDKKHRQLGRGYPTTLIKRCVWPLEFNRLTMSAIGNSSVLSPNRLTQNDLQLGKIIVAFGRKIVILRADNFTTTKLDLDYPVEEITEGFSVPKKQTIAKLQKTKNNPTEVLRALAFMQISGKLDSERKFVIEYHIEDESVAIFEQSAGRSRKFLERTSKYKGEEFRVEDLQVDRICTINKFQFVINETDENTRRWLQKLSNNE